MKSMNIYFDLKRFEASKNFGIFPGRRDEDGGGFLIERCREVNHLRAGLSYRQRRCPQINFLVNSNKTRKLK